MLPAKTLLDGTVLDDTVLDDTVLKDTVLKDTVLKDTVLKERYRIEGALGRGGMGAVYRATDLRLGHTVAVKQILRGGAALLAAFEREAQLLASLRHPALPKVTDYFVEPSGHFLVMEFIPGADLATRMQQSGRPFPVEQVLPWADQLLGVLAYLHCQNPPVVHRDIKPANLKLNEEGAVILLDFGLAKGAPGHSPAERSIAGYTLHYAPPEQLRGEPTDERSDLYALAATLYDLLSGTKPPDALRRLGAATDARTSPLQPVHVLNPAVPPALADVIHRALALDPAARLASAAAMRSALRVADGETTRILPTTGGAAAGSGESSTVEAAPPHNLPAQLTSFVGREAEVATVQRILQEGGTRLVTLVGPGGIGKTRLALSIASHSLPAFRDGVFLVSLAPITEAHLVLPAIAQALGLREAANTTVLQSLQAHLLHKQVLLVLDNFEQVLAAAPLVRELLITCTGLKLLVTSRAALQVQGEQEFPVPVLELPPPKQLPPPDELAQFAAIQLFLERARSVRPGFEMSGTNAAAIAEICRRLDGLPLAIELAAAYVKVLPAPAILTRLAQRFELLSSGARDVPDRQRTLRASIGWSYDLLDPAEGTLFRRLSIFTGSFNLEAAEALCQRIGSVPVPLLGGITSLIDKSLLRPVESADPEPRFVMLESIREFGLKQLEAAGEAQMVAAAHAEYYYELAREAGRHMWGANIAEWVARLDAENDNLRAVLNYYLASDGLHSDEHRNEHSDEHSVKSSGPDPGGPEPIGPDGAERSLTLTGSLWRFWEIRGYIVEGRTWLTRALAQRPGAYPASRWLPLHGAGNLAVDQGEYGVAREYYTEALELLQNMLYTQADPKERWGTLRGIANTLTNLGNIALLQSDIPQATSYTEEALALHRQLSNKIGIAITINNLAAISLSQSLYAQAEALSQESLALYRELGDDRGIGWNLARLGTIARFCGRLAQATALYHECRQLYEKLSNQADMASLRFELGELARQGGDYRAAEGHYRAGLALAQELGSKRDRAELLGGMALVACHAGDLGTADALCRESVALHREIGHRFGLSASLHWCGHIARAQEQHTVADAFYRESLTLQARLGDQRGVTESIHALGLLAATVHAQPGRATRLLSAASALRQALGLPPVPLPQAAHGEGEDVMDALRTALGQDAFAVAEAEGAVMTLDEAVALALQRMGEGDA